MCMALRMLRVRVCPMFCVHDGWVWCTCLPALFLLLLSVWSRSVRPLLSVVLFWLPVCLFSPFSLFPPCSSFSAVVGFVTICLTRSHAGSLRCCCRCLSCSLVLSSCLFFLRLLLLLSVFFLFSSSSSSSSSSSLLPQQCSANQLGKRSRLTQMDRRSLTWKVVFWEWSYLILGGSYLGALFEVLSCSISGYASVIEF